ncbi:MAG: manganese efflux pump [Bacteroidales bacterium]|nr:manganese efflux pump [Bacteroidales bacterium]
MTILELIILAVSLCFDTFAVSLGGGMSLKNNKLSKKASIMAFFGFFQAALLFAGWAAGSLFAHHIMEWDHWIAFLILAYIGGKMIYENISCKEDEDLSGEDGACNKHNSVDLEHLRTLTVLAIATSIDAVAVGLSLALVDISFAKVSIVTFATFIFTAIASFIGMESGRKVGAIVGRRASLLGGVILVVIGVKIILEHLNF